MPEAKDISLYAFIIPFGLQLIVLSIQGTCDIPLTIQVNYLMPISSWITLLGLTLSFAFGLRALARSKAVLLWVIPSGIYLASAVFLFAQ